MMLTSFSTLGQQLHPIRLRPAVRWGVDLPQWLNYLHGSGSLLRFISDVYHFWATMLKIQETAKGWFQLVFSPLPTSLFSTSLKAFDLWSFNKNSFQLLLCTWTTLDLLSMLACKTELAVMFPPPPHHTSLNIPTFGHASQYPGPAHFVKG